MKYHLTQHHQHNVLKYFFTLKIDQTGQIEPPSGPVLPTGHIFDTTGLNSLLYVCVLRQKQHRQRAVGGGVLAS